MLSQHYYLHSYPHMPMIPSSATCQPSPSSRISQWANEVTRHTQAPLTNATQSYQSKLRSSTKRTYPTCSKPAPLAKATANPRLPKRKAFVMSDSPQKPPVVSLKRARGRPRTKDLPNVEGTGSIAEESTPDAPSSIPILPPSKSSRASKSRSPTKKTTLPSLNQAKSEIAIDMIYLRSCTPPVKRMSLQDLREKQDKIPLAVECLYKKLKNIPPGVIPQQLKVRCLPNM